MHGQKLRRKKKACIFKKKQIAKGMTLSQESASLLFFACTSNLLDLGPWKSERQEACHVNKKLKHDLCV